MTTRPASWEVTCTVCPVLKSKKEAFGTAPTKRVLRVTQYCRDVLVVWQMKFIKTVSTEATVHAWTRLGALSPGSTPGAAPCANATGTMVCVSRKTAAAGKFRGIFEERRAHGDGSALSHSNSARKSRWAKASGSPTTACHGLNSMILRQSQGLRDGKQAHRPTCCFGCYPDRSTGTPKILAVQPY
jgi:hypothetical protein